jgi:hypothetical protein
MLGYRHDREDWDYLRANSVQFPAACCAVGEIPDDYHPKLTKKNQKRTNSCVGHGLSCLMAAVQFLLTGQDRNYSAWYAYLSAQRASDMFGTDEGATIAGAIKAASSVGVCSDELAPFPGCYDTRLSAQAAAQAKEHTLTQFSELRGYDEIWRYASSNQGPVLIGTQWYEGHQNIGPDGLETKQKALAGAMLGYHCRCVIGWSPRRDRQGRHYLRCQNSHSEAWGNQGESEIEPVLFDEWANDRFAAFFGGSDSRPFEPRPITWQNQNWMPV